MKKFKVVRFVRFICGNIYTEGNTSTKINEKNPGN